MIKSMTGFGKATLESGGRTINVEIRSLNSKGADISLRVSSFLRNYEGELRNEISRLLERGKIDLNLQIDNDTETPPVEINKELARSYLNQLSDLAKDLKINLTDPLYHILKFPDIFVSGKSEPDEQEWSDIRACVKLAVDQLNEFRIAEGKSLQSDFEKRINNISLSLQEITKLDQNRLLLIKERIRNNISELAGNVKIDENRFEQELIYYIERLDINEEKVRLNAHLEYFLETMKENSPGRKLNFISQEIGREINTIGSKASDAQIQRHVVLMKDELEKIKEQANNVL
jgi:uncharacterized protein (TIGR00255 family)